MITDFDLTPVGRFGPLHTDRMERWFALTPATGPACLMRAAGKHHRRLPCPGCDVVGQSTLLDHGSTWRAPDGRRVVVGEPYELTPADLAALRQHAASLGLVIEQLPISPWLPGSTHAWAAYLPGPLLVPAPEDGAVLRFREREVIEEPGQSPCVKWPKTPVTVHLSEHLRPPLCPECDGPALPGGDFRHLTGCDLAAVDWAQYEDDLA